MKIKIIAVIYNDEIVAAHAGKTEKEVLQKLADGINEDLPDRPNASNVIDWFLRQGYKYEIYDDEINLMEDR